MNLRALPFPHVLSWRVISLGICSTLCVPTSGQFAACSGVFFDVSINETADKTTVMHGSETWSATDHNLYF